ncbi:MAG: ABC transporter permease [Pseudomonadaceae bacterium]|nr:ABC transporter permease [Pseudomonadaceae bacterium]
MSSLRSLAGIALASLRSRLLTVVLTVISIGVSVALIASVDRVRSEAKASFSSTISGADLLVGARTSGLNLLLYSIFRIGDATNSVSWQSVEYIEALDPVDWVIPLSLGDSHRGYRVLGTDQRYFEHYRFGRDQTLDFTYGQPFASADGAVLGSAVAEALGYSLDDDIVVSHGVGETSFLQHSDRPFRVVGILSPTGTPVDRTVHVSLAGIERMHGGSHHDDEAHSSTHASHEAQEAEHHDSGETHGDEHAGEDEQAHEDEDEHAHEEAHAHEEEHGNQAEPEASDESLHQTETDAQTTVTPDSVTALILGLNSPIAVLTTARSLNEYQQEPLTAVLPGVALQQLWSLIGVAELSLLVVSGFVVVAGLIGLVTTLLSSLSQRRREMAVLRSVGAKPVHIGLLLVSEALAMGAAGALFGLVLTQLVILLAKPVVFDQLGVVLMNGWPTSFEWQIAALVVVASALAAILPAAIAYRYTLADGLLSRA